MVARNNRTCESFPPPPDAPDSPPVTAFLYARWLGGKNVEVAA
jgi:hypothetical protein